MRIQPGSPPLMLTIEQISLLTGVSKSTLRYWEKSYGDFLQPHRTRSNRREYSLEDLDVVKTIKHLVEEEHLTTRGVLLRLGETRGEGGGGDPRSDKLSQTSRDPPFSSRGGLK